MGFTVNKPVVNAFKYAAIVSLDPAGTGPSGVAVRLTAPLGDVAKGRLRFPDYTYQGSVFNERFQDELSEYLLRHLSVDQRVLLVSEDCVFRSMHIARSVGRAIGVMESLLSYLGYGDPHATLFVPTKTFRKAAFGITKLEAGRDGWKTMAVARVFEQYREVVRDDLAEAVLLSDYIVLNKPEVWK